MANVKAHSSDFAFTPSVSVVQTRKGSRPTAKTSMVCREGHAFLLPPEGTIAEMN